MVSIIETDKGSKLFLSKISGMNPQEVEKYWSDVGSKIAARPAYSMLAGDDEPYYQLKRKKFLELLHTIDFRNQRVLELGSGPGGNLIEIWKHQPAYLAGADISMEMLSLARHHLPSAIELFKSSETLPFENKSFDKVLSVTVLQHNTDDQMFEKMICEMGRVSAHEVLFFERIQTTREGNDLCLGRPVAEYAAALGSSFELAYRKPITLYLSQRIAGVTRKFLNGASRKEGEPLSRLTIGIQNLILPFTSWVDSKMRLESDLSLLLFRRKSTVPEVS
jgi:ubiquinone/menaquinone biosynthesis C-methylase UbiE